MAGKDASKAMALMSLKEEDAVPEWEDLPEEQQKILNDWVIFFQKRYAIVGTVEGTTNKL
jgi:membrane-associated progesterone receptor component